MNASMTTPADNVLDFMDESFFLDFRAQGHGPMIQFVWIYRHDPDLDALRRFQHNLGRGLLGRCIEHSPLPFGRSRWVAWTPPADLDVAERPRPQDELTSWTDEEAARPLSVENGPPWRLAIQPLAGGGAAVSLLVAHAVADGVGMSNSVADAVNGVTRDLGLPPPHSRTRGRALAEDVRQLIRDLPKAARALVLSPLAAKEVPMRVRAGLEKRARRADRPAALPAANAGRARRLPSLTMLIDIPQWDECAASLGGTSNSLLLGFTSRLCYLLGWLDTDGLANLAMPVNERTPGDNRANALASVTLTLDPAVASDLGGIRAAVKSALSGLERARGRIMAPLALVPFVPKFAANRVQTVVQRSASITCSHFGDLDPAVNRPDGTDAEVFYVRHARTPEMAEPEMLRRAGGLFFPVASGRLGGRIHISICHSDAEGSTTVGELTAVAQRALDDFGLTASIIS